MFFKCYLPFQIQNYISDPPKEIRDRNINNISMFQKFINDTLYKPSADKRASAILTHNNWGLLLSPYFQEHKLHQGYYDEISPEGLILVRDQISGNLIRKDMSGLTTQGYFIDLKNENLLTSLSTEDCVFFLGLINPVFRQFMSQKRIDELSEKLKNKYVSLPSNGLYQKFDPALFKVGFRFEDLGYLFNKSTSDYINNKRLDADEIWYDGSGFTDEIFKSIYSYVFQDLSNNSYTLKNFLEHITICILPNAKEEGTVTQNVNCFYISEEHTYFKDMYIILNNSQERLEDLPLGQTTRRGPFIQLSQQPVRNPSYYSVIPTDYWASHKLLDLDLNVATESPIRFSISVNKRVPNKVSQKSDNNIGRVMHYSSKVPSYKASFLMTKDEEKYCSLNKGYSPPYLGIELEYIVKKSKTQKIDRVALCSKIVKDIANSPFGDHCLMKYDRSIGEGEISNATGFEIVTVPATLAYHKKMFDEHFFTYNSVNKKWEMRYPLMASTSCGLHVHISKEAFLPPAQNERVSEKKFKNTFKLRIGKYITFLSAKDNLKFICEIAGRPPNMYCNPNPIKDKNKFGVFNGIGSARNIDVRKPYSGYGPPGGDHNSARRFIVNTTNSETIEVRIFDSTIERGQLFRRLEFCHALIEFVKVCSLRELTVYHFVKWLVDEKDSRLEYPHLLHWLEIRKMIGVTKKIAKPDPNNNKMKKLIKIYGPCLLAPPVVQEKGVKGYSWNFEKPVKLTKPPRSFV